MLQYKLFHQGDKSMSSSTLILLLMLFCIVMVLVITNIVYRQNQLKRINQQRILAMQDMLEKQYNNRVESIDVITRAMLDKQCELTEGCIRLKQLLDYVGSDLLELDQFQVISLMYSETEHMPIKEQWKQLDKSAKRKFSKHRLALEEEHEEAIHAALLLLKQHEFLAYKNLN